MANSTVVCTDKTGTLTQNVMTVVAGSVGVHAKFVQRIDENVGRSPVEKAGTSDKKFRDDFAFDMKELNSVLNPAQKELFNAAIAINSTAFEDHHHATGELKFVAECSRCHVLGPSSTPDLRKLNDGLHATFKDIVLKGVLAPAGMERFDDILSAQDVDDIHAYLINQSWAAYREQEAAAPHP